MMKGPKMVLDKAALLAEMELQTEIVKLKTGNVIVKELSAVDYMEAFESPLSQDAQGEYSAVRFTALMVVRSAVDEAGDRIMADDDAEAFRNGGGSVFRKIAAAVNRVNGTTGEEAKN